MDALDAIATRASVRRFTDEPVDRRDLERMLEAAVRAPSAENEQPWRFVVVQDRALVGQIGRLSQLGGRALFGPKRGELERRFASMEEARRKAVVEGMASGEFFSFIGRASALVVALADTRSRFALHGACAAVENLLLAAHALGLGACWTMVGAADEEALRGIKDAVGRPEAHWELVGVVAIGHPAESPRPRPRKPLSEVVEWR